MKTRMLAEHTFDPSTPRSLNWGQPGLKVSSRTAKLHRETLSGMNEWMNEWPKQVCTLSPLIVNIVLKMKVLVCVNSQEKIKVSDRKEKNNIFICRVYNLIYRKYWTEPGVVHAHNPSIWEVEPKGLGVQGLPHYYVASLSPARNVGETYLKKTNIRKHKENHNVLALINSIRVNILIVIFLLGR